MQLDLEFPVFSTSAIAVDHGYHLYAGLSSALDATVPAKWFERLGPTSETGMRDRAARLTIAVNRADLSKTTSALFGPTTDVSVLPPENAWIEMGNDFHS